MEQTVYVGLGSNIGNKWGNLKQALDYIAGIEGVKLIKCSSFYQTLPWGKVDQEDFLNAVVEIETILSPMDLLNLLQDIEIKMGRQRQEKWGPRIIDLDILLYGEEKMNSEELVLPHPFLTERLFVLVPLEEISPGLVFPDGTKVKEVLDRVKAREGVQSVWKMNS